VLSVADDSQEKQFFSVTDNLKKARCSLSWSRLGILKDEQSGLLMHTATTESGYVVRADEKLTVFVELAWPIRLDAKGRGQNRLGRKNLKSET